MKNYFKSDGKDALRATLSQPTLIGFDFDGTLAPIVNTPDVAVTPTPIARRLTALARLCPVAIISGRSIKDVRGRLGFMPKFVVGNHGAEGLPGHYDSIEDKCMDALRERIFSHAAEMAVLGICIEDKGLSFSLHYRGSRTELPALRFIEALLAPFRNDLAIFGGKYVVNVATAGAPDKFAALQALLEESGMAGAVFIGDDVTDETVFAGAPSTWLTIRVGGKVPDSRAMYFVDSQSQVVNLIQDMLDLLTAYGHRG